jgi:hypothetical protein
MGVVKLNSTSEVLSEAKNYARTLRAIGQDLTELYPEDLEIQVTGAEFLATGVGLTQSLRETLEEGNAIGGAWSRLTSKKSKPSSVAIPRQQQRFTRKYTLDTINRLDEIGRPAKADKEGKADIYRLGERLRTVGRIVDSCGGTLIRVVKNNNSMKFEYRDSDGIEHKEEYTNLALYKYQQRYFAERST